MGNEQLNIVIGKYLDGTADEAEIRLVEEWYMSFECNNGLTAGITGTELASLVSGGLHRLKAALDLEDAPAADAPGTRSRDQQDQPVRGAGEKKFQNKSFRNS